MTGKDNLLKILLCSTSLIWANGTPIVHEQDDTSKDRMPGNPRADPFTVETNLLQTTPMSVFLCSVTGICKTYFEFCDHRNRRCQKCEDYLYTCESRNVTVPVNCTNFCVDYLFRKWLDEYQKAKSPTATLQTSTISLITTETEKEGFIADCQRAFPDVVHIVLIVGNVFWISVISMQKLRRCQTQSRQNSKESGDVTLKPLIGKDSMSYKSMPTKDDNQGMMPSAAANDDSLAETIPKREKSTEKYMPSRGGEKPNHVEESKDSNNKDTRFHHIVDTKVGPHEPILSSSTKPNYNQDLRPTATASVHVNINVAPMPDMKENAQLPYPQEITQLGVQEQGEVNNNHPAKHNNQKPVSDLDISSKMLLPESTADLKEVST